MQRQIPQLLTKAVSIYLDHGATELFRRIVKMMNHPALRNFKYNLKYSTGTAPMVKTIRINPNDVNYLVVPRFQKSLHNRGYHIRGGNWDVRTHNVEIDFNGNFINSISEQGLVPFENFTLFQSMRNRFVNGYDWEETKYYQWEKKMLQKGVRNNSKASIMSRCERIDELYESIEQNGYQTQEKLNESRSNHTRHEVMIDIGRRGQLFLDDGRHRLCIAKILGLDSIPVKILVRHECWQQTRVSITDMYSEDIEPSLRDHPDLNDIVTNY